MVTRTNSRVRRGSRRSTSRSSSGPLSGTRKVRSAESAVGARNEAALATLGADAVLPYEPAGPSDPRGRAVPRGRVDPDGATEASLAEKPASVGQQEGRDFVSRDHDW